MNVHGGKSIAVHRVFVVQTGHLQYDFGKPILPCFFHHHVWDIAHMQHTHILVLCIFILGTKYPTPSTTTESYKGSFLPYVLYNCQ